MKKITVAFFLVINCLHGADILTLVQTLDRNDTAAFKSLIHTIEDANSARFDNQKTILMYASWVGNSEAVQHLTLKGANINASDATGSTALHLAIWKNHTQIALFLLQNGASAGAMSQDGMTPLDIALLRSNTAIMEAIKKKKPKLKPLL